MTGLDTNVLVRYLAQDDAKQAAAATRLVESLTPAEPGFVSHVVLVESAWVLESCYEADAVRIATVVETLLRSESIRVERAEVVWRALRRFRDGKGDFSDVLVTGLAAEAGCHAVYTFDRGAVKRAGMTLLA